MPNADSSRWTWTLGLLTAASACLVPVGAEAAVDGACDCGAWEFSADTVGLQGLPSSALQADERIDRRSNTASASETERFPRDARLPLLNLVEIRSQLLLEPGPPIYLVAPSQSPPGRPGGV